jgi:hypothetical protein
VLGDEPGAAAGAQPEQGPRSVEHGGRHIEHGPRHIEPGFRDIEPGVRDIEPGSRHIEPGSRDIRDIEPGARYSVVRLRRSFHVLAHSAIWKQHITADSRATRPVRFGRNPRVRNPVFLRPHITAETSGVVPPRHQLEDAWPRDIPPGLQPLETRGLFD